MALTRLPLNKVTMPFRRYHTPSLVRHAASASIRPPFVKIITGLAGDADSVRGGPVETGASRVVGCAVDSLEAVVDGFSSVATNSLDTDFSIVGAGDGNGLATARGTAN